MNAARAGRRPDRSPGLRAQLKAMIWRGVRQVLRVFRALPEWTTRRPEDSWHAKLRQDPEMFGVHGEAARHGGTVQKIDASRPGMHLNAAVLAAPGDATESNPSEEALAILQQLPASRLEDSHAWSVLARDAVPATTVALLQNSEHLVVVSRQRPAEDGAAHPSGRTAG